MEGCNHSNHKFLCGGCAQVSYCSEECALSHWDNGHKFECVDGGVKRDAPDEDEFKDTVQKMLKAAEEAELLEDVPLDDEEDQKYDNLNIDELTYRDFGALQRNATNMYRKTKLDLAVTEYVSDPAIIFIPDIKDTLYYLVKLVKNAEAIFEGKFMSYAEMERNFNIRFVTATKTLGLSPFNQSRGKVAKIPIKAIFTQLLKKDREKWPEKAKGLVMIANDARMKDVGPYREERLLNVLRKYGINNIGPLRAGFKVSNPNKYFARIARFLEYYLHDMTDELLNGLIERQIIPTIAMRRPELLDSNVKENVLSELSNQRAKRMFQVYRSWLKDPSPRNIEKKRIFFWSILGGSDLSKLDAKYRDPRMIMDPKTNKEILSIIYERLKAEHPEWLV